jgi:hypothetical protein
MATASSHHRVPSPESAEKWRAYMYEILFERVLFQGGATGHMVARWSKRISDGGALRNATPAAWELPGTGEETAFQTYHAGRAGAQPYPPLARKRLPGADSIAPCRYVIPAFLPQVSEPFAFCLSEKPNQRERDAEI